MLILAAKEVYFHNPLTKLNYMNIRVQPYFCMCAPCNNSTGARMRGVVATQNSSEFKNSLYYSLELSVIIDFLIVLSLELGVTIDLLIVF